MKGRIVPTMFAVVSLDNYCVKVSNHIPMSSFVSLVG